ncbi:MAG: hypothetical protein ACOC46_03940 [Pirellulales bacterium]
MAASVVVVGLGAGGWWYLFGGAIHPEARYLPPRCERFISIRWPELAPTGFARRFPELPGLNIAQRCATFLENAELPPREVERINAGQAADRTEWLIVYRLARGGVPEEFMAKPGLGQVEYEEDQVRGVAMYRYPASDTAVAFPEKGVIVNGSADMVRSSLRRWRSGFRGPSSELLETVDFNAMSVVLTDGPPPGSGRCLLAGRIGFGRRDPGDGGPLRLRPNGPIPPPASPRRRAPCGPARAVARSLAR